MENRQGAMNLAFVSRQRKLVRTSIVFDNQGLPHANRHGYLSLGDCVTDLINHNALYVQKLWVIFVVSGNDVKLISDSSLKLSKKPR